LSGFGRKKRLQTHYATPPDARSALAASRTLLPTRRQEGLRGRKKPGAIRPPCLLENSSRPGFERAKIRRSDDQRIMEKYKFGLDGGEDSILVAAISAPRGNFFESWPGLSRRSTPSCC
jgi:hypothetical protein